jgi:hypothetical protein
MGGRSLHVRVTTMEELDQGSLHPSVKNPETDVSRQGFEPRSIKDTYY